MRTPVAILLLLLLAAAIFVTASSLMLPPTVASHFDASGIANGFMPRAIYVRFMLFFVVAFPGILAVLIHCSLGWARARINVPHRDYWLAPARRADTIAYIRGQSLGFAMLLVLLLCFTHWRVLIANSVEPPHLDSVWMFGGLSAFVLLVVFFVWRFHLHFRRRS